MDSASNGDQSAFVPKLTYLAMSQGFARELVTRVARQANNLSEVVYSSPRRRRKLNIAEPNIIHSIVIGI
jgi:hypothetical protein